MSFFRQSGITIRSACRGTTLAMPDRDALLDACEQGQRRRLQSCLAKHSADAPSWSVQWGKRAGDVLRPQDIVAVLRCDDVTVELAYAHKGILAEVLIAPGTRVATGTRLARLERRARAVVQPELPTKEVLRQFVSRQRQDAEMITSLQAELTIHRQLVGRLRSEIAALGPYRGPGEEMTPDPKFRRLKLEFSKHYHPDARPLGDAERMRRERVFQEFWPIVEEIERS